MAIKYMRDGEERIRFEHGKWDSFWGYTCDKCGIAIGDTEGAYEHEKTCNGERETDAQGRRIMWKGSM
jgi:hypothetical protein